MRHRSFCTLGVQTGPFAACSANFVAIFLSLPDLYTGGSLFLLPQREEERKQQGLDMGKGDSLKSFCTWGIQSGPFAARQTDFDPKCVSTFFSLFTRLPASHNKPFLYHGDWGERKEGRRKALASQPANKLHPLSPRMHALQKALSFQFHKLSLSF